MTEHILKPLYIRGASRTLHQVGLSSRTNCGYDITPHWKLVDLVQAQELNLKECGRCRGENKTFSEIEERKLRYREMNRTLSKVQDEVVFLDFNDLSSEQKVLAIPGLFDSAYHQKQNESYRLIYQEYQERKDAEKAYRARVIPPLAPNDEGYVYLLHRLGTSFYKIGYSINPIRRLSQVKTESLCTNIQLIHAFPTEAMKRDEQKLHTVFNPYRRYGEWFELPNEAVQLIKLIKGGL
jgi:hypothetical protein